MDFTIGIKVEHTYYAQLLGSRNPRGELTLTTLQDYQRTAVISLFLFKENKKKKISEIKLTGLPQKKAGQLKISTRGLISGKELTLDIQVKDGPKISKKIPLRQFIGKSNKTGIILLLLLALILIGGIGIFLFPGFTDKNTEGTDSTVLITTDTMKDDPLPAAIPGKNESVINQPENDDDDDDDDDEKEEKPQEEQKPEEIKVGDNESLQKKAAEVPAYAPPELPAVYFPPDSSALSRKEESQLEKIIPLLRTVPHRWELRIQGHTASFGTEEGRIWLSRERAERVLQFFKEKGFIPPFQITLQAMGELNPATLDPDAQYLNRRVTFELVPPAE